MVGGTAKNTIKRCGGRNSQESAHHGAIAVGRYWEIYGSGGVPGEWSRRDEDEKGGWRDAQKWNKDLRRPQHAPGSITPSGHGS